MSLCFLDCSLDLVIRVFCRWIDMQSFLRLDSSFSSREQRKAFLNILQNHAMVLPILPAKNDALLWATKRRVKFNTFLIDEGVELDMVEEYMRCVHKPLFVLAKKLSDTTRFCHMVTTHCRALVSIVFRSCSLSSPVNDIFLGCTTLKELFIHCCTNVSADIFENASCPHLTTLSMCHCNCDDLCMAAAINMNMEITNLGLGSNNLSDQALRDAITKLPQLQKLEIYALRVSDTTMEAIAKACPLLHAIHLGVCVGLTDAAICSVTTHCKHLTQLLTYNRKQNFSQGALQAIASNSPNLIRLAVSKCSGQTVEDEVRLLTSCSRLESLMMPFTSPESIKYLPPSLTRLSLWAMNTTDELLVAIGQHCGILTELDIMNCNPNSRLFSAEVGLTAIAKGCTRLQYLTLHRDAEQVSELTLQRWRKTCPLVEVLNAHGFWEYHILIPTCLRMQYHRTYFLFVFASTAFLVSVRI